MANYDKAIRELKAKLDRQKDALQATEELIAGLETLKEKNNVPKPR